MLFDLEDSSSPPFSIYETDRIAELIFFLRGHIFQAQRACVSPHLNALLMFRECVFFNCIRNFKALQKKKEDSVISFL